MLLGLLRLVGAEDSPIFPGATLEMIADGYKFTEGPACDADGNVYFTDQPNDQILKWDTEGKITTFMRPCGRANGLCFDSVGFLWACCEGPSELRRIRADRTVTTVVDSYEGKRLNGPNDVWIRSDNGAYFTDPFYARGYLKRGPKEIGEHVYFLSADGQRLIRVVDDMKQPNGIIGTPDSRALYVSDLGSGRTYRYRIFPDGSLLNKTLFCELGSDGMTIDDRGNVYLTGKGVTIFSPSGRQLTHIDVPQNWTGNICFGGKDRMTLIITACAAVYKLKMSVKGVGSQ